MIDQETQKVKLILDGKAGSIGEKLTADVASNVCGIKFAQEYLHRRYPCGTI